ncbi:MAG: hypothetical protein ACT4P5_21460 [Armatimonadota bacterium]
MASNLQVDQDLNATAQSVKDQNGNTSPLTLSTDAVGIGTTSPGAKLHVSGGAVHIANAGEGAVLLFLGIERHWQLRQFGTGARSALELASVGGGGNKNFIINTTGGVGIGTTTPHERLEVNGNILATGDVRLAGADCAEEFDLDEGQTLEPGTVMVISDEEQLRHCTDAYDTKVAGVLSGAGDCKPGIILGRQSSLHKRIPLALTGKAYCKVDAHYAPIALGDLLTTSPTPGHAMKATDPLKAFGAVIGKALRPLSQGQGLIPLLVALQ